MKKLRQLKKMGYMILYCLLLASCNARVNNSTTEIRSDTSKKNHLYLDVHNLNGPVTFEAVAGAHQKDLATQQKYGVSFINYWVDEKDGRVVCLSQAPDSSAVINTHKEAHGLVPVSVEKVKQGQ